MNNAAAEQLELPSSDPASCGWGQPAEPVHDALEVEEEIDEEYDKHASGSAKHEISHVPPPPPPAASWERHPDGPTPPACPPSHEKGSVTVPPPPPSKRIRVAPPASEPEDDRWRTMETPFNPKNWTSVLNEFGVDTMAQQQLFLLSQLSEDGAWRANAIIGKLLTKRGKGEDVRCPSHFVHKCIQTARKAMGAPEHQQK